MPESFRTSRPLPDIRNFVFFIMFTQRPLDCMTDFHGLSLLMHSSKESAMTIKFSAYSNSNGTPVQYSRERASNTKIKAENRAPIYADLYAKLFTVLTINLHPTLGIGIHCLNNTDGPLLNTEAPQSPPKDSPDQKLSPNQQMRRKVVCWQHGISPAAGRNKYCIRVIPANINEGLL